LRQSRALTRWAGWRQDLGATLRQLDWWRPVGVALVLHVPFVMGLLGDQVPDWLGTAWQVSATLVGLGVALVVFLLQAAGSQSVSSRATYRAMLAHTWIVWPTALALVFLVSVGVVERYGASRGASSWAETWALAVFVAQMAAFGAAFWRTLDVVSPAGIGRVLKATFDDAMRSAVKTSLLRRQMVVDLRQLCDNRVSYGSPLSPGQAVLAANAGLLTDVDRRLPRALDQMQLGQRVTLTLVPGRRLNADDALAKVEDARGRWLERMIRNAVHIRAGAFPVAAAVPVFNDVLDVGRRALGSGSQRSFQEAMQLLVDCLADLPRTYGEWGVPYALEYVREPFSLATEDEILVGLVGLSDDVFRNGRPEAVMLMSDVAAGLVEAGLRQDAPLLIDQGTSLWRHQLRVADTIGVSELEQRVHERIGLLSANAVRMHEHGLKDADAPLDRRLAAQPGMLRLWRHQIEVMKLYLDGREEERFASAWHHWIEWARHWQPEHDVEDLELRTMVGGVREQQQAARELEVARSVLGAKHELEDERAHLMFALGAWALEQRLQGKLASDQWLRLVPYVVGAASDASAALRLLRWLWTEQRLGLLQRWMLSGWDGKPGWQPPDPHVIAQLWGTLLLLRGMQIGTAMPELELGPAAADIGPALLAQLNRIASDPTKWDEAAGGQIAARVAAARAVIEYAVRRDTEQAEQRLAEASLDAERIRDYAARQRQVYAEGDYLRQRMLVVGAVDVEEAADAFGTPSVGAVLSKRPFTDLDGANVVVDSERLVKTLVERYLQAAYGALAAIAERVEGEGGEAAIQAIADLRRAGYEPDAVLIPHDVHLRAMLSSHPEWQWAREFVREHAYFATLSGVPVYDPGPGDATALVVCELGNSVQRVERRRPGDASSIRVMVEIIDAQRAAHLWDAGARPPGVTDDRPTQEAALVSGYVEVHVDLDVQWRRSKRRGPAVRRVEMPPQGDRPRSRS
jgi:hypothetical protein